MQKCSINEISEGKNKHQNLLSKKSHELAFVERWTMRQAQCLCTLGPQKGF